MAMVCPQCNSSFDQRLVCPKCCVKLLYQPVHRGARDGIAESPERWQQTPWGRLFVGLLLAQGLYYVLQHLCTAGLRVAQDEAVVNIWATLTGLIVLQSLQAVSVLAAGLLIGAGQRRGFLFGSVVGVWNGVLFILGQQWLGHSLTPINFLGEPILQAAFGAIGGFAGGLIWKPLPSLEITKDAPKSFAVAPTVKGPSSFAGPVAWGRVLTGVTLTVGGVVWVDVIRDFVLEASEGKLKIDTHLQAELVTWEISALAILAGSALAGATTKNGMKQGLSVGLGSSVALFAVRLASINFNPQLLLLTCLTAISLGLVGGWFGGQLLPPVSGPARRKRLRAVSPY